MATENFALLLRPEAAGIFSTTLELFKKIDWKSDSKPAPICLVCSEVDVSGSLAVVDIVPADGREPPFRVWLPHSLILLVFDFEDARSIGFLQGRE